MIAYAFSHIGKVRKTNQDSYIVLPKPGLIAVADGMGGHLGGDVASCQAIRILQEYVDQHQDGSIEELLFEAFQEANRKIYEAAKNNSVLNGMGTTLTAAMVDGNKLAIAHVGDSRAYLLQEGEFTQLTNDHSFVGELLRHGDISLQEASEHPQKHLLIRALGTSENIDIDISIFEIEKESKLLLTTDGLTNMLSKDEIHEIILGEKPQDAVNRLVELALERGGTDNITVILGAMEGEVCDE